MRCSGQFCLAMTIPTASLIDRRTKVYPVEAKREAGHNLETRPLFLSSTVSTHPCCSCSKFSSDHFVDRLRSHFSLLTYGFPIRCSNLDHVASTTAEVLVTTSWTFVVENSYRLIQNVATNSTDPGTYTLEIARREDGTQLDAIVISRVD